MLHVHGFADYFFQTAYAEWWTERGYDFYALDLRKYGRSILPHQTPNYVTDLAHYHPELDLAWDRVTVRGHRHVVLSGHSTGGLIVPLWADARRGARLGRAGSFSTPRGSTCREGVGPARADARWCSRSRSGSRGGSSRAR